MLRPKFIFSIFIIIIGTLHVIKPDIVSDIIKKSYKHSPFIKHEADLESRKIFTIIFGVVLISLGIYTLILSLG